MTANPRNGQRTATLPGHRCATAFTPTPSSTESPSTTSGTARDVLRSASPKLDDSANDLNIPPSGDGSSNG